MNAENACSFLTAALVALTIPRPTATPKPVEPVTVAVKSGNVTLHALLWHPEGPGPFPAVLVNHGSGRTREELERLGPYERQADTFAPVFAQHGYVLLFLFREGVGLSSDVGRSAIDLMTDEAAAHGQDARNALQMKLLEGRELTDALAGLAFVRGLADVDPRRIAVVGHSFGGSLTVLMTEREPALRAAVVFSGAGYSWDRSPDLRERLLAAVRRTSVPLFFLHAENDFSTNSGKVLAAELTRLGKPNRLKIYPPVGKTPEEGHDFPLNSIPAWESDVFTFLDEFVRK
jgi:carboxymethylenebutenolidase